MRKVCIDGVTYSSAGVASREIGVKESLVRSRCSMSTETYKDWYYVDQGEKVIQQRQDKRLRSVIIDGVRYESVAEAAKTLGLNHTTVSTRVRDTKGKWDDWHYEGAAKVDPQYTNSTYEYWQKTAKGWKQLRKVNQ